MNRELLELLLCDCGGAYREEEESLACPSCGRRVPLRDGIPLFTPPPGEIHPSAKVARGPNLGTPWRRANWRFLAAEVARVPADALILDVGAGRGDFAAALGGHRTLALDVYPYPEVDLVADLTRVNPFRPASVDVIVLLNVLEHVYDARGLLATLATILKPGGRLLLAVPFLVKIHQAPLDFVRYTHYALERMAADAGFAVERLEGYYNPVFLLDEGLGNLRWAVMRELPRPRRVGLKLVLAGFAAGRWALTRLLGEAAARAIPLDETYSQSPTGYQAVLRKLSPIAGKEGSPAAHP